MNLIFIHGPPASGKLTVGRELCVLTGYRLFHNHLTVDMLLAVFEFGSPAFVELREEIWLRVMAEAAATGVSGLVFTFTPEDTVRPGFAKRLVERVTSAGGTVHFVQLKCPESILESRLENEPRREFNKLRSVTLFRELKAKGAFTVDPVPEGISIDTSVTTARHAARQIAAFFRLP